MTSFTETVVKKNILDQWTGTFYYEHRFYHVVAETEEAAKDAVSSSIAKIEEYIRRCDAAAKELKLLLRSRKILFVGGECVVRVPPPAYGYEHCHGLKSVGPLWRAAADEAAKDDEFHQSLYRLTGVPSILLQERIQ